MILNDLLFQKKVNQFVVLLFVWLVSHWQIQPCFFVYNALVMREGVKSFFAMVAAHTTFTESSKRHFTRGEMNDRVVDASAAKLTLCSNFAGGSFIACKEIQCERMWHRVDFEDEFVQ